MQCRYGMVYDLKLPTPIMNRCRTKPYYADNLGTLFGEDYPD